jgi:hypothetical protein
MKSISRRTKLIGSTATALLATALLAAAAVAVTSPDQTRETYVAQVEPICKKNTKANEQILDGAEKKIKNGQLKVAAGQFGKAATAFGGAIKQIKAVPQPVADVAKLGKWTKALEGETKLLTEISKALKAEDKGKVRNLSVQLEHNGRVANNAVLGFDFDYCLIESSRFS